MSRIDLPQGVWPVMLTPYHEDGAIDWDALDVLTDWYLRSGPAGLFAVSGSSEVHQLTDDEKVEMAKRIVARTAGRAPVVASAIVLAPLDRQADLVRRIADAGVQAVILGGCQLAEPNEDDQTLRRRLETLLSLTGEVPLGLYEIPQPYHRQFPPDTLGWAAATGRFAFFKDTTGNLDTIRAKIQAVRGTSLRLFNASTPTLLESLRAGADGFSGIGANYYPWLYVALCKRFRDRPSEAARIQQFLTQHDPVVHQRYPAAAKRSLAMLGLPIRSFCRVKTEPLTEQDIDNLTRLRGEAEEICREVAVQV